MDEYNTAKNDLSTQREAELVDAYIAALQRQIDAPVPAGLDAGLAAFVRTLMLAESAKSTVSSSSLNATQSRVWQRAFIAAQAATYQRSRLADQNEIEGANPMQLSYHAAQKPVNKEAVRLAYKATDTRWMISRALGYLAAAAAGFAVLLFTAMLIQALYRNQSPQQGHPSNGSSTSGAANSVAQTDTATPVPSLIPSETPTAAPTIIPTSTPLPVTVIAGTLAVTPDASGQLNVSPVIPTVPPLVSAAGIASPAGRLGTVIHGELTAGQPSTIYAFPVSHDGIAYMVLTSSDFNVSLSTSVALAEGGGGGGSGSGGGSSVNMVTRIDSIAYVTTGSTLTVVVSSQSGGETGKFELDVFWSPQIMISPDEPYTSTMGPDNAFQFLIFEANAGDQIDVAVESAAGSTTDLVMDLSEFVMDVSTLNASGTQPMILSAGSSLPLNMQGCAVMPQLLCGDDNSGRGNDPELSNMLVWHTGKVALMIRNVRNDGAGTFTVTMTRRAAPMLDNAATGTLTLTGATPSNALIFTPIKGQQVNFTAQATGGNIAAQIIVTILQNGQTVKTLTLNSADAVARSVTFATTDPVLIAAQYAQWPGAGADTTEVEISTK